MLDRFLRRSYARLGGRYRMLFLATQIPAAALIAFVVVGVLAAYYDPPVAQVLLLAAITAAFTAAGVAFTIVRQKRTLTAMASWRGRDGRARARRSRRGTQLRTTPCARCAATPSPPTRSWCCRARRRW